MRHWLFLYTPYEWDEAAGQLLWVIAVGMCRVRCKLVTPELKPEASLVRTESNSVRGWQLRYYGAKVPALSLALQVVVPSVIFSTVFDRTPNKLPYPY